MSTKIIDCFTFYNEMDLLNYRLNILNNVVDYFVIVESTHTHTGKEKKLYFNDNKHLFEKFNNKIIHIIVDDLPFQYSNVDITNSQAWKNENYQRNAISRGFGCINNLNPNDIIIITDLDEIVNPKLLSHIRNENIPNNICSLVMDFYYYNLNTKFQHSWNSGKILYYKKYKELQMTCNDIRLSIQSSEILNAGWHLSYFGDSKFIQNKLQNFAHTEFNNENYVNLSKIEENVKNHVSLFDTHFNVANPSNKINIKDNTNLPPEYDTYLTKFYTL